MISKSIWISLTAVDYHDNFSAKRFDLTIIFIEDSQYFNTGQQH